MSALVGAAGYRLVLPEGWVRLNVRDDKQATVDSVLAEIPLDSLPRDERAKRRVAVEGRLRAAIDNARKIDAYAMYLPLHGMHGLAIPASFVVAAASDLMGSGTDEQILEALMGSPGARPVVLDGSDAVRTETTNVTMDEASGIEVGAVQIVYTVHVPGTTEWLVVVYDVMTSDEPDEDYRQFVDALVALFDGIMSTFRWTFADD